MTFLSILFTTRNKQLDIISIGDCLPIKARKKRLEETKLRYGVMQPEGRVDCEQKHVAFGAVGTTTKLRKHGKYV